MAEPVQRGDRCPGSGQRPTLILRAAERVLIGDHVTVHRGRAMCPVCGREVGLNATGLLTAHIRGRVGAGDGADDFQPEVGEQTVAAVGRRAEILEPDRLEDLRRSIVMLPPGRLVSIDRERALGIIEELQRLQRSDRELRASLADWDED